MAEAAVDHYFGGWQATGNRPDFKLPDIPLTGQATSVTVYSPTTTQSQVTLAESVGLKSRSKDAIALEVANTILSGEGTGSLLFRDVRSQHGLVYTIASSLDFGEDSSIFGITFAADAKNVDAAEASASADIEKMRTQPLPALDIERAKEILLSNDLLPLASYGGLSNALLGSLEASIDGDEVDDYYPKMLAITPQDVRDAMKRWIDPTHFARVIVAPGT
jgi:zinc protease